MTKTHTTAVAAPKRPRLNKEQAIKDLVSADNSNQATLSEASQYIQTEEDFAAFLRARRDKLNKTQAQIANECHYKSGEYWGLIEANKRSITHQQLPVVADALKLDRQSFAKLFLRIHSPNLYTIFWGEEELALAEPAEQKQFVQISQSSIMLLNRIYAMPPNKRKTVLDMVEMLSVAK